MDGTPRECYILETGSGRCLFHLDFRAYAGGHGGVSGEVTTTDRTGGVDITALTGMAGYVQHTARGAASVADSARFCFAPRPGLLSVSLGFNDYSKRRHAQEPAAGAAGTAGANDRAASSTLLGAGPGVGGGGPRVRGRLDREGETNDTHLTHTVSVGNEMVVFARLGSEHVVVRRRLVSPSLPTCPWLSVRVFTCRCAVLRLARERWCPAGMRAW